MTVPSAVRPRPTALQQWWVLTFRSIVPTLRNGELVTAIAASVIVTAGFYIPLNDVMGGAIDGMSSYAQFLTPLIVLQAISFASISGGVPGGNRRRPRHQSTIRRHADRPGDTARRPHVGQRVPVCVGLTIALICGYVIGFRFHRGPPYTIGFCLLVLLIGVDLSLLADLIGTSRKSPEATTPLLMGPQLIFGLLSVGIQPAERFPEWIQPIVRNQPISQWVYALRALAGDTTAAAASVTLVGDGADVFWLLGMLVILVPMAPSFCGRS